MKKSLLKPIKKPAHSPYSKELGKFIEKITKLSKQGKLNYEKDSFWSTSPQKIGKTDSSNLDSLLYRKA
jgi:hypothetical protein